VQVKQSQTTATVEVTFGINRPYQISYLDTSTPSTSLGLAPLAALPWVPYVKSKKPRL
jgi:hypothetical protein